MSLEERDPEEINRINLERMETAVDLANHGADIKFGPDGAVVDASLSTEQMEKARQEMAKEHAGEKFVPELSSVVEKIEDLANSKDPIQLAPEHVESLKALLARLNSSAEIIKLMAEKGGRNFIERKKMDNGLTEINDSGKYSLIDEQGKLFDFEGKTTFDEVWHWNPFIIVRIGEYEQIKRLDGAPLKIKEKSGEVTEYRTYGWKTKGKDIDVDAFEAFRKSLVQ